MNTQVTSFERRGVLDYPGRRSDVNFITDGKEVIELPKDNLDALNEIDKYLVANGLPDLSKRTPVVAYGANVSPGALATKFDKYSVEGTQMTHAEMRTVPSIYVDMKGSDVVWHGTPGGYSGGYFAELYQGEETKDTSIQVAIQFLTSEQLAVLHTTEGETYGVGVIKDIDLGGGNLIDAVSYIARDSNILLDEQGKPIAVEGVKREGSDLEVTDARGALEHTLGDAAVISAIGTLSPEEYISGNEGLSAKEKTARQRQVQEALQANGKNRAMRHATVDENNYGRANFISLPRGATRTTPHNTTAIELLETSIAKIRPSKEEFDKRVAELDAISPSTPLLNRLKSDPAVKIRHDSDKELLDPRRGEALHARLPHVLNGRK